MRVCAPPALPGPFFLTSLRLPLPPPRSRGELAERQQKIGKHMADLTKLAEEYNVAVVLLNQCMAVPDAMSFGPQIKPVGGHIMSHFSTTRVMLKKGRDTTRIAKIHDSPSCPEADAQYMIAKGGIMDVE